MADRDVRVVDSVDEVHPNQWNNVVTQSDLGTLFHRHEWVALIEDALGATARHVVVEKGGNPVALFPNIYWDIHVPGFEDLARKLPVRELVSIAPGYGGPVVTGDEDTCLELAFDALSDLGGPTTLLHRVRTNDPDYTRYGKTFAKQGYEPVAVNCHHRIALSRDWDDIVADMDRSRRRALRKLEDRDAEVRAEPLEEDVLRETHADYVANVERAGGETFDYEFFAALAEHLGDRVRIATAVVDGREVGRYLYLLDEEQSAVHYYFAAIADEEHFEDHPSELLHTETMRWAKEQGYRYYDFGGTGADFRDGVFRHKDGYGGEAIPTCQWQKGFSRLGWPAFKAARSVYRSRAY